MSDHHHRHAHGDSDHDYDDDHGHVHGKVGHVHAPASFGRAFAIGITLNLVYVAAEAFYGVAAHSLALLADAGHNFGDVLGLVAAWTAAILTTRQPSQRFTYGLGRTSVLAALGNAVALLVITGGIAWEALRRLMEPQPVGGITIMVVAAIGIAINGATALLFMAGRKGDLNIRGAFLHMAADALVALGVVVTGGLILLTGWLWLDPLIGLAVSAVIVAGTWSLLREALHLSLDAVPPKIDRAKVEHYMNELPGIVEVHDLHIWGLSTTESALTAHLVCADDIVNETLLPQVCIEIKRRFGIGHATIQFETPEQARLCGLRPDHVV
ncbi:MAG TPA: cation diffusion facilitator family transporter [Acetobacteraceae bacterium]|nr:cation diffusion facilitator family transporter [Acetobacteraceae bacterium]